MLENYSPKLIFYPDNPHDNYTNAVMGINKEFALNFFGSTTTKTTTKTTVKASSKQEEIINMILNNPHISTKEMAENLNLSVDGVRYHIRKMKKAGLIKYEDSSKLDKWIVIK